MAYIEFLRYTAIKAIMMCDDEDLLDFVDKLLIHEMREEVELHGRVQRIVKDRKSRHRAEPAGNG
jgi:hypothetical protein